LETELSKLPIDADKLKEELEKLSHVADNFTLAPQGVNASVSVNFGQNEVTVSSNINTDGSETLT